MTFALATPVAATEPTSATTSPPAREVAPEPRTAADQGLRLDQRERVFEATGYQTLLVAGAVGGAAAVGGIAAGTSGAIAAGGAVLMMYLFIP